jgi:hypothetical protein
MFPVFLKTTDSDILLNILYMIVATIPGLFSLYSVTCGQPWGKRKEGGERGGEGGGGKKSTIRF